MKSEAGDISKNLIKLRRDVELIKNILMAEGDLTGYAKKQLIKARAEKKEEYTSLEEL